MCAMFLSSFFAQGDMLGLLGAALAGAGQVAALHSVREGVGLSPDIYGKKLKESPNENRLGINFRELLSISPCLVFAGQW